ncbi:MAG: beta-ketoacyl-[acyl-carrier-protein] synthase family protein [Myxococcales bacterium]|nr:beta-ketoacyl-[acyl-carrier-protein] synthase family protein [Myxococcales bacterium]
MSTDSTRLVAVTGLGVVSSLGNTLRASYENARRGSSGIRRYEGRWLEGPARAHHARVGGAVEGFDPSQHVDPKWLDRQEPALAFAMAAAHEALADAGLPPRAEEPDRFGCIVGSGLPGAELWHRALHAAYVEARADAIPKMCAINITATATPGFMAIAMSLRGPCFGVGNACASGGASIGLAADQIRLGRADRMLAGGCESSMRSLLSYTCFVDAGMNVTDDPTRACSPFSRDRRGFVLAEGAGMLVLERLDLARARGARIYAILAGESHANDAYHVISPDPTGEAWARTMRGAIAVSGVSADDVDIVSAHATATPQGDVAETRAIKAALGARARDVSVSATKALHGHAFGATGAIETALALAAFRDGIVLPTINLAVPDPECDLDYVPSEARRRRARVLVKNSFGAGGVASSLVFCEPSFAP